uniref:Putative mrna splicing n=1 Tax=Corethrella appendiculata TaxID=1370023 RepID=U5ER40_9DIPT
MGRRSINTTKSGKYMNPTDQARKEARKKELKKNKKQRQMVRAAVLKGKDPAQLIEEMEKIDEMEFNVYQPSPLNEKVLKEKRKKLKETLDRVMRLYQTDDPDTWADLKRKEVDYEKRRNKRVQYYESVRYAESVQIDDIPLPTALEMPTSISIPRIQIPIAQPPSLPQKVHPTPSILKKTSTLDIDYVDDDDEIPGCPPGPPPELLLMRELDSDYENEETETRKQKSIKFVDEIIEKGKLQKSTDESNDKSKPNSVQQKMLALSGQNIDDFMKEMESVQKIKELDQQINKSNETFVQDKNKESDKHIKETIPSAPLHVPSIPNMQPSILFRPPPLRPSLPSLPIRMLGRPGIPAPPRMGIRMPPGPPPGAPMNKSHHSKHSSGMQHPSHSREQKSATISAKPQIRNLSADVTRFVPAALRSKKDDVKKVKPKPQFNDIKPTETSRWPTKDDAYLEFMKEMQNFL